MLCMEFVLTPGMVFAIRRIFLFGGENMEIETRLILQSLLLGVGLAMDAFSVSLANGLNEPCMRQRKICGIAVQAMPYMQ